MATARNIWILPEPTFAIRHSDDGVVVCGLDVDDGQIIVADTVKQHGVSFYCGENRIHSATDVSRL